MNRRVVVTGLGAVTPTGHTVSEFWQSVREGVCGIGPITRFNTEGYKAKLAAEVKDFDGRGRLGFKEARRMELFSQYAVAAAQEAFEQSGLDMEQEDPFCGGVIIGSGTGSLSAVEQTTTTIGDKGPSRVNPLVVPMFISNMAAGNAALRLGFKGKCFGAVSACASGTHSIGEAFNSIVSGELDFCLAGGAESAICPTSLAGFAALTALSTETDPNRASIPFDRERSGFVLGEGAGVLMLEELSHAKKRGAHILAELTGYGATDDAYHITSPDPSGEGAAMAMKLALKRAGTKPEEVDYINAHGTSTPYNDLFETRAIREVFGEHADHILVNSTKSMIGHLLGAAGAVEAVVCVKSLEEGFVHETINTRETDEECDLNYVLGAPIEREIEYALTNSLGFGGHNATLLFKKWRDESCI